MIAAFVVVTGAGIGGYFYTNSLVDASKTELNSAGTELQKLVKSRYFPSQENIKILQDNVTQLEGTIKPIEEKVLKGGDDQLGSIVAKNPVTWKSNDLDATVKELTAAAQSKKVQLPPDYYFSFSRYQRSNPSEQATLLLGKQLYGVRQLSSILFDSSTGGAISSLKSIRRSSEEEGGGSPGGAANDVGAETFRAPIVTAANGLYRIYPFDVDFVGTTNGLRTFLNSLQQAPVLFVVRALQVANTRVDSPKLSDLDKASASDSHAAGAGRDFIFGSEQLQIRARIDMIEWIGVKTAAAAAIEPAKRSPQPAR